MIVRDAASETDRSRPRARTRVLLVLVTVALAALWPALHAIAQGDFTAIIGPGTESKPFPLLRRELPALAARSNQGHDGQQFYVMARAPFRPRQVAPYLNDPSYRYRRILFSAAAWVLAPHGGTALIVALLGLGLAGVALSAASLSALPRAPAWLPLVVAGTPGVIVSLALSLSDALALGCTLLAFAAAAHQRWRLVVLAVVAGVLTRETVALAGIALVFAPGMPARARVAVAVTPVAVLGAWIMWVDHLLTESAGSGAAAQFSLPLAGWVGSTDTATGLIVGLLLALVMVVGIGHAADVPHVRVYLLLLLFLMAVLADNVTESWVNTSRVVIAGLPLSAWVIARA
jgi:hypothetical protein